MSGYRCAGSMSGLPLRGIILRRATRGVDFVGGARQSRARALSG